MTTWNPYTKSGNAWTYNQVGITYNQSTDNNRPIFYNAIGKLANWITQAFS